MPRLIHELNPKVPEALCALIARLMAKKPDERIQSAAEAGELLAKCLEAFQLQGEEFHLDEKVLARIHGQNTATTAISTVRQSRRFFYLSAALIAAGLILVLGTGSAVYFWPWKGTHASLVVPGVPEEQKAPKSSPQEPEAWASLFNGKDLTN